MSNFEDNWVWEGDPDWAGDPDWGWDEEAKEWVKKRKPKEHIPEKAESGRDQCEFVHSDKHQCHNKAKWWSGYQKKQYCDMHTSGGGTPLTDRMINNPPHYTSHPSGVECIQVTEHMGFCVGNAIKYLWRADEKWDALEDLKKAKWYVEREIEKRERGSEDGDQ